MPGSNPAPDPTPYPDVNAVLNELLLNVRAILGDRSVGMYLHGSLALGDFTPNSSDIDFLVVTDGELSPELVADLRAMHERISVGSSPWGRMLEGAYIPQSALRRYDPANARHPHIEWGESLCVEQFDSAWVIQRHVLREYGVTLAGPPLRTLIDPVDPGDLRQALLDLVRDWWAPKLEDPTLLRYAGYQVYAVLTMCRVLYTLNMGDVVSKPVAARWAQGGLGKPWTSLIEQAVAWRDGAPFDHLDETLKFLEYTVEYCQQDGNGNRD